MLGNKNTNTELGAGFRYDDVTGIELSRAIKREFIETLQKGNVNETNAYFMWNQTLELNDKFSLNGGLRFDYFRFAYQDLFTNETGFRDQQRSILSPKLNFVYMPSQTVKIYLNNGIGFHSNDTRVILDNAARDILPRVVGTDVGIILKPVKDLILKTALWHFYSEQEFVYVGDEGIVEPGGKTRRIGIDVSARYQFTPWLYGDVDLNYTKARAIDAPKGGNYVPLAPAFTSIGGISARMKNGFSGSLRYRFINHRPANESNTVIAQGYFITDILLAYNWKKFELTISAENIFSSEWREAQFDTESRLQFDPQPVSEIHYTPGTPRFLKAGISLKF
jgi:outer membrane receptor protein involved in Fe transport